MLAPPTLEELRHQESVNNRATLGAPPWSRSRCCSSGSVPASTWGRPAATEAGPDDGVLENAAISQEENPAPGVVWYADGQLHLDHTVLAVEGLKDMTRIGTGVVYGDDQGRVVYAADDGSREVLGHKDPEVPVAATDETGWAAWVETGGDQTKLVVKEASTGNDVASAVVDAGAQVVAVDGDSVYYVDVAGAHELHPGGSTAVRDGQPARPPRRPLPNPRLPARRGHDRGRPVLLQRRVPGPGTGRRTLSRRQPRGHPSGGHDQVVLYDTRSGQALPNGVPDGDHVVTFAPGSRLTVTYVVAPAGSVTRTGARAPHVRAHRHAECAVAARIPNQGGTPVLAR